MNTEPVKQGYYESMNRFNKIDGDKFSNCHNQVFNTDTDNVMETRTRLSDSKVCIIKFYPDGNGYTIFVES